MKKCVEENRDKGEIKKTKGKEMWLRKKGKKEEEKVLRWFWLYMGCGATA